MFKFDYKMDKKPMGNLSGHISTMSISWLGGKEYGDEVVMTLYPSHMLAKGLVTARAMITTAVKIP